MPRIRHTNVANPAGLTLVEVIIAILVIAALVAVSVMVLNRRERARLQAIADSEPGKIFRVECAPDKTSFEMNEMITLTAHLTNASKHKLNYGIMATEPSWLRLKDSRGETVDEAWTRLMFVDGYEVGDVGETTYADGSVGLIELSIEVSKGSRLKLSFETADVPEGTWTAELWLDNCADHSSPYPPGKSTAHHVVSAPFQLTVLPEANSP